MVRRTLLALFLAFPLLAASQTQHKPAAAPAPKPAEDTQVYRNAAFGFRYKIPYGWVERTKEMREPAVASPEAAPESASDASSSAPSTPDSEGKTAAKTKPQGEVLLAVFERPPNASGDSVNSAVVIASESAAAYPGLKKAVDYLGPLSELATAKGFKSDGDPDIAEIDSRELVRADFSKPMTDKMTMHQSTLILLAKGQIVSFTFIAGSADEIDDLIDGLHFAATRSKAR